MAVKNKKPEIRFKGFAGDWEHRKFSETFTKISNNTLSRAELNYNSGLAKNIHYGDILIKFGELLDIKRDELPYITDDFLSNKFKSSKLQIGDVIMADAAEDEMVGKCTELVNVGEEIIVSGLHTIPSRPTQFFASGYLGYFMNSPVYHNQLLRLMQGTKVLSISKTTLQDTAINYPIDGEEQSQIGTFFKNLDHLLTLHQQKVNKLVTIKKAMLEKMFPKNGANVPEIRFKGFTEDWVEKKIKDVCLISTGKSNTQDRVDDGIYPFYVRSPIIERSNRYLYNEEAVLTVGDGVGTGKVFHYVSGKYDLHQRVYRMFDFNDGISGKYFYYYFSNHFYDRVMAMTAKTSVDSVRYEMISEMDIEFPSQKEQILITFLFNNMDHLINLQKKELEKLKNLKKAFLEKMFV